MNITRQDQLDYLRGLAALMVVCNHTRGAFFIGGKQLLDKDASPLNLAAVALLQITSFGTEAVILFFVLSGFAMANSISLSSNTPRFYMKRLIRIWPPYLAACLLAKIIALIVETPFNLATTAFYIHPGRNNVTPQFWSLPYEVIFYGICPLILATASRIRFAFCLSIVFLLSSAVVRGMVINSWQSIFVNFVGYELLLFSVGALAFIYIERIPVLSRYIIWLLLLGVLAVAWISKSRLGEVNIISMIAISVISVFLIKSVRVFPRLNFGYFSYSLYLFHYPLIVMIMYVIKRSSILDSILMSPVYWVPITMVIVAVCFSLYWITERVSNRWVARLRSAPSQGSLRRAGLAKS